jgi:hypothetical protein
MAQELQTGFMPEVPPPPEQLPEQHLEKIELDPTASSATTTPLPYVAVTASPAPRPLPKDVILIEVESILSENIAVLYKNLPAEKKQIFKNRGEQVATQINAMIKSGLLRIKKILELIREWLIIIPGINHFYLEQESKIKADKIQLMYEREHAPAV